MATKTNNAEVIIGLALIGGLGYALLSSSKPAVESSIAGGGGASIAGGGGAGAGSGGALLVYGAPSPAEAPSKKTTASGTTTGGGTPVPIQPLQPVININEAPVNIPTPASSKDSKDSGGNRAPKKAPKYTPSHPQYTIPSQQPAPSKKELEAQKIAELTSWFISEPLMSGFVSEPEFQAKYGNSKKAAAKIESLFRFGWRGF